MYTETSCWESYMATTFHFEEKKFEKQGARLFVLPTPNIIYPSGSSDI